MIKLFDTVITTPDHFLYGYIVQVVEDTSSKTFTGKIIGNILNPESNVNMNKIIPNLNKSDFSSYLHSVCFN